MFEFKKIAIVLLVLMACTLFLGVVSAHDPFPPEIKILSPKNNDEVNNIVTIRASIKVHTAVDSNGVNFTISGPNKYKKLLRDMNTNDGISVKWDTSNVANGKYKISVSAKDVDYEYPGVKDFNVKVVNKKIASKIELNDYSIGSNKKTNIIATLKDKNNKVIANKYLVFKINGKSYKSLTDKGGIAKFTFNAGNGNYSLNTSFLGDNIYFSSSNSSTVKVSSDTPYLSLYDVVGNKNQKVSIKAILKDSKGKVLKNKNINFYINNKKIKTVKTNSKGLASFNYKINLNGGNYTIFAEYLAKTGVVKSASTLNVPQSSISLKISSSKSYPKVGTKVTLYYRIVNNGPDTGKDVLFAYKFPKGLKYISSQAPGLKKYFAKYNAIGWYLKSAKLGTNLLKLTVLTKNSGRQLLTPQILKTATYDLSIAHKKNLYLTVG
ncbi:MAG: Ig-like domain-containing protein [Methanobrevibacter sp.]|jgi:hypothetical protein|nr:Ig-like domain-containing protein [Candidatus Methanoflexus mossambicus]